MSPPNPSSRSILIVGGGTFGTTTAYHLSQRGYKSVKVLDRWAPPSLEAAGNDINKVIRADYPDPLYARLASNAMRVWENQKGILKGLFHRTGWLMAAADASLPFVEASIKTAGEMGFEQGKKMTADEVSTQWPAFTGSQDGWKTYWNSGAGWANARAALKRFAEEAQTAGVEYISGEEGHVTRLLFDADSTCIGVQCANGTAYFADVVVLAAGAAAAKLLDMKGQLVAKGHTVGHIQLSPEEVEKYRHIPIIDHLEGGIMFPPQEDGIIKLGAVDFVTNYSPAHPGVSLPRYRSDNPNDGIPKPIEDKIRQFVREIMPELADREWFETRICWDADTVDYNFLISPHPHYPHLNLAVGGSAHGFKFFPVLGQYIVDMLEGKLDAETAWQWRWRPGLQKAKDSVNPHPTPLKDLNDIEGFKGMSQRSSKL